MDGPSDCALYGHPLVNGYQCPCRERTHPTRKSVVEPKPYPPPLQDPSLMMDALLSEKEYKRWRKTKAGPNELKYSRQIYP